MAIEARGAQRNEGARALAAAMAVLLLGGCTGTKNPTVKSTSACADLANARCQESQVCAPFEFNTRHVPDAGSSCIAGEEALCNASLAAPSTGNNAYAVEGCVGVYQ